MNTLLCSTGALITSKNGREHRRIAEFAPLLHCDGFEFMMYPTWYDIWEQITDDVPKMNLNIPLFHADKTIGDIISRNESGDLERAHELFEINCIMADRIGAEKMVLHLWGGMHSDRDIRNNIEQYVVLNEIARKYGVLLTIENVVCNRHDPMTHLKELAENYPEIAFTFDVRFAKFHEQLDLAFTKEYQWLWENGVDFEFGRKGSSSHIRHIHISDFSGGYMEWSKLGGALHPREGNINFEKLFKDLKKKSYDNTITIESTCTIEDGIDTEKMNRTLDYIRSLMK